MAKIKTIQLLSTGSIEDNAPWKKADTEGIVKFLAAYSEKFFSTSFTSVNSLWEDIKAAIDQAINDHVPTKRTPARHTHPWIDTWLRQASRRKTRAFHEAKQTKSLVDWNRYKLLKMQAQKEISPHG